MTNLRLQDDLVIDVKKGIAYHINRDTPVEYDNEYLDKIKAKTKKKAINDARKEIVDIFCPDGMVLDIGCGDMSFIKHFKAAYGYDIIPQVIEDLGSAYVNPYKSIPDDVEAITFWDSLEHIPEPKDLLKHIKKQTIFVSIPIIDKIVKVRGWKHYRPNEHYWYFTYDGFVDYMDKQGFKLLSWNNTESMLGREDIETFIFRRK